MPLSVDPGEEHLATSQQASRQADARMFLDLEMGATCPLTMEEPSGLALQWHRSPYLCGTSSNTYGG
jgi:hypothetical protein